MAYKQLKLWFDEELAKMLANKIQPLYPDFNKRQFIQKVKKHCQRFCKQLAIA